LNYYAWHGYEDASVLAAMLDLVESKESEEELDGIVPLHSSIETPE